MNSKYVFALSLLCTLASSSVLADEGIVLNQKKLTINQADVVLIRTSETPKKLLLTFPIREGRTFCAEYATRMVYGPDSSCGYDTHWRYECRDVCSHQDSNGSCDQNEQRCDNFPYEEMRSCEHPETYCANYDVAYHTEMSKVRLWFDDLPTLAPGETERFRMTGDGAVDSGKEYYALDVLDSKAPYTVKVSWKLFFGDTIVVKKKQ